MALFIGITMLLSIVGFALMYSGGRNIGKNTQKFSRIMEKMLTPEERSIILRSGFTLIEYIYPYNCSNCTEKIKLYKDFMRDKDISKYTILSIYPTNGSLLIDRITGINGETVELNGVNDMASLEKIYCNIAIRKPDICIFYNL